MSLTQCLCYQDSQLVCFRAICLELLFRVFGNLKKWPNRRILVHSWEPIYKGEQCSSNGLYQGTERSVSGSPWRDWHKCSWPTCWWNINHSICGLGSHSRLWPSNQEIHHWGIIIFVGQTPNISANGRAQFPPWLRQIILCNESTVQELIAVCYMLRCLGMKVLYASLICGDSLGVIQNCTVKGSLLKKKHIADAYHKTRRLQLQELVTR